MKEERDRASVFFLFVFFVRVDRMFFEFFVSLRIKTPLANIILVKDTIEALQKLAIHHRNTFKHLQVIGITGSNGRL